MDKSEENKENKDYIIVIHVNSYLNSIYKMLDDSLFGNIYTRQNNYISNPIKIDIPNNNVFKKCKIDGNIILRTKSGYDQPEIPYNFFIITNQGNRKYFNENLKSCNVLGSFTLVNSSSIKLIYPNNNLDLNVYTYKIMEKTQLTNVSNNISLSIKAHALNNYWRNDQELLIKENDSAEMYFVNFTWNSLDPSCMFEINMKLKFK